MNSNKNQIKWTVTSPLKTKFISKMPKSLKYTLIVLLPILIGLLIKIARFLRARAMKYN